MAISAEQAVVMTSGGMDSTVLLYWAISRGYVVTPMFIDYGQHCAATELASLRANLPTHGANDVEIVNVSDVFKSSTSRMIVPTNLWQEKIESNDLMLPYRNLFLIVTGAAYAASRGARYLFAAFINSNHAYEIDASSAFLAGTSSLIGNLGSVKLEMPFRELSKLEVATIGISLDAPIGTTFSCQVNANEHCGACPNCVERLGAFLAIASGSQK
jgi:7-cyano-7-deazaguanine synthase